MTGLGALTELDLDHLDLRVGRVRDELCLVEAAVLVAAAEVAGRDLPDQVAAMHAMIGADRALACVVRETALLRAAVQRQDRVARERTEAHRRDVEDAGI